MRYLWLSLVLAVAVGACSDTDTSATEGTATETPTTVQDVDACVLVDASDAASVLGSPAVVDATPAGGFGAASSCVWVTASEALLIVSVFEGREFYGGDARPGTAVLDAGDQGYIAVEPTMGGVELQVVKDEWVVSLSATPFGVVDIEGLPAAMTILAQQAVDRLP